jgi:F420-0:gamma-glutamyl ligase
MGNTSECTPAAVVRGHGLAMTDFCGWVPGIEPEQDLFKDTLMNPISE